MERRALAELGGRHHNGCGLVLVGEDRVLDGHGGLELAEAVVGHLDGDRGGVLIVGHAGDGALGLADLVGVGAGLIEGDLVEGERYLGAGRGVLGRDPHGRGSRHRRIGLIIAGRLDGELEPVARLPVASLQDLDEPRIALGGLGDVDLVGAAGLVDILERAVLNAHRCMQLAIAGLGNLNDHPSRGRTIRIIGQALDGLPRMLLHDVIFVRSLALEAERTVKGKVDRSLCLILRSLDRCGQLGSSCAVLALGHGGAVDRSQRKGEFIAIEPLAALEHLGELGGTGHALARIGRVDHDRVGSIRILESSRQSLGADHRGVERVDRLPLAGAVCELDQLAHLLEGAVTVVGHGHLKLVIGLVVRHIGERRILRHLLGNLECECLAGIGLRELHTIEHVIHRGGRAVSGGTHIDVRNTLGKLGLGGLVLAVDREGELAVLHVASAQRLGDVQAHAAIGEGALRLVGVGERLVLQGDGIHVELTVARVGNNDGSDSGGIRVLNAGNRAGGILAHYILIGARLGEGDLIAKGERDALACRSPRAGGNRRLMDLITGSIQWHRSIGSEGIRLDGKAERVTLLPGASVQNLLKLKLRLGGVTRVHVNRVGMVSVPKDRVHDLLRVRLGGVYADYLNRLVQSRTLVVLNLPDGLLKMHGAVGVINRLDIDAEHRPIVRYARELAVGRHDLLQAEGERLPCVGLGKRKRIQAIGDSGVLAVRGGVVVLELAVGIGEELVSISRLHRIGVDARHGKRELSGLQITTGKLLDHGQRGPGGREVGMRGVCVHKGGVSGARALAVVVRNLCRQRTLIVRYRNGDLAHVTVVLHALGILDGSLLPDHEVVDARLGKAHLAHACGCSLAVLKLAKLDLKRIEPIVVAQYDVVVLKGLLSCHVAELGRHYKGELLVRLCIAAVQGLLHRDGTVALRRQLGCGDAVDVVEHNILLGHHSAVLLIGLGHAHLGRVVMTGVHGLDLERNRVNSSVVGHAVQSMRAVMVVDSAGRDDLLQLIGKRTEMLCVKLDLREGHALARVAHVQGAVRLQARLGERGLLGVVARGLDRELEHVVRKRLLAGVIGVVLARLGRGLGGLGVKAVGEGRRAIRDSLGLCELMAIVANGLCHRYHGGIQGAVGVLVLNAHRYGIACSRVGDTRHKILGTDLGHGIGERTGLVERDLAEVARGVAVGHLDRLGACRCLGALGHGGAVQAGQLELKLSRDIPAIERLLVFHEVSRSKVHSLHVVGVYERVLLGLVLLDVAIGLVRGLAVNGRQRKAGGLVLLGYRIVRASRQTVQHERLAILHLLLARAVRVKRKVEQITRRQSVGVQHLGLNGLALHGGHIHHKGELLAGHDGLLVQTLVRRNGCILGDAQGRRHLKCNAAVIAKVGHNNVLRAVGVLPTRVGCMGCRLGGVVLFGNDLIVDAGQAGGAGLEHDVAIGVVTPVLALLQRRKAGTLEADNLLLLDHGAIGVLGIIRLLIVIGVRGIGRADHMVLAGLLAEDRGVLGEVIEGVALGGSIGCRGVTQRSTVELCLVVEVGVEQRLALGVEVILDVCLELGVGGRIAQSAHDGVLHLRLEAHVVEHMERVRLDHVHGGRALLYINVELAQGDESRRDLDRYDIARCKIRGAFYRDFDLVEVARGVQRVLDRALIGNGRGSLIDGGV